MSRNATRKMPPAAGRTGVARLEIEQFARRLHKLMAQNNMSQSDLARAVWGTTEDNRGYTVARGRERISQYIRGKSLPDPKNLAAIARALHVTPEELAPDIAAASVATDNPEVGMTAIAGHPDKVLLQVNKLVPFGIAAQVINLLAGLDTAA